MQSNEGMIRAFIACAIIAVVVNVILVAMPFDHGPAFWIGFAFVWIGVGLLVILNYYLFSQARSGRAGLYRSSILFVSLGYLALALAASIVFMAIGSVPTWAVIAVHVVLLGGALLLILGGDTGAKLVEADENRTRAEISFIQSLRTQVSSALAYVTDPEAKQAISTLSDKLRFSDPVSNASVAFIEEQLLSQMTDLNSAVSEGNVESIKALCAQMCQAIEQRNAIVRQTK